MIKDLFILICVDSGNVTDSNKLAFQDSLIRHQQTVIRECETAINRERSAFETWIKAEAKIDKMQNDFQDYLETELSEQRKSETNRSWILFGSGVIITTLLTLLLQ